MFNEVLIWMVSGRQVDNRVSVAMVLKGHEVCVMYQIVYDRPSHLIRG